MGICQTKKQNLNSIPQTSSQSIKQEQKSPKETPFKTCPNSPLDKKLGKSIYSPQPEGHLVISRQRKPLSVQRIQQNLNFIPSSYNSPLLETAASKKYTFIGQHKSNHHIQIVQNNKTGQLVLLESIQKHKESNEKYIGWLQKVYLDHPNILKVIEIHQDRQNYQVVFENFEGTPLSDLIHGGAKVPKNIVSQICYQLFSILQYLHQQNIVHGNLTLRSFEYILQDNKYIVKLVNLKGIIIKEENNIEIIKLLPPECLYTQDLYTQQRDIWTVGLLCYTLRKGQLPYKIQMNHQLFEILVVMKGHIFDFSKKKDKIYQQFLESTLAKDINLRKDSDWLLNHKFITDYKIKELSEQQILLQNFLKNEPCCQFLQLIIQFIAQEFCWADFLIIQKLFLEGDTDMDGLLNKQELRKLIQNYRLKFEGIDDRIEKIFDTYELGQDEGINSIQFMSLALNREQLITQQSIEATFSIFSQGKPEITTKGLKRHLQCETANLKTEFSELTNDYNSLNFQQFKVMLVSLLN